MPLQGVAVAVNRTGTGAGDDGMLNIGAADHRGDGGVALHGIVCDSQRRFLEQLREQFR